MQKITYTNYRGESLVLSQQQPYALSRIEGLGDVDADVQMQKAPYQDGTTFIDALLQPRFISMMVTIVGNDVSKKREQLARVFNPKVGGTLLYENGQVQRSIEAYPEHVPKYPSEDRGGQFQVSLINLVCPNPYWQDAQPSVDEMAVFVGKFEFPLEIDHEIGMEFGDQGEKIIISNPGDVETPVRIEFNGPAVNPKVTNLTTGEYILVNRTIAEEQKLILTTDFGDKHVEIHDENGLVENAFHWVDLGSTFWELQPGENEIQYEADVGMDVARVYITHSNRYVGV